MLISSCYFLNKTRTHLVALVTEKYDIFNYVLLKAFFAREWLLMKVTLSLISLIVFLRTQMPYGTQADGGKFFRTLFFCLINVMFNGMQELSMTVFRLPVFYKQRDLLFYPAWAFAMPIWVLRIPVSLIESGIWIVLTYYTIGFAPAASR